MLTNTGQSKIDFGKLLSCYKTTVDPFANFDDPLLTLFYN